MPVTETGADLEQRAINVIRGLCMDGPQAANSGHPGTGMALAPLAHVLWTRVMKYDASAPDWPDRDRFVLSNGHASILLYSMLYLSGTGDLTLGDIKQFRQWGSKTPGHPEVHHTKGVEVTTGPLGQGFGNGVGMGIAERYLRSRFGSDACDHHTFVIAGDGCLEEGVSHEAGSLAGHLKLGRLVYVYDDNHITIDGPTELSYSDDAGKRFEAYGWHVDRIGEVANDTDALEAALRRAMAVEDKAATRKSSGACLQALVDVVPGLMAGGADLTGNTGTVIKDHGVQSAAEPAGRQIYFGVREHGMATALNGMAMHGGVVPVGGTFFVFSDYMRGAVRLSALSEAKVIYSWTHDSVGLGEDGPTHQPIEHLPSLRAMPQLRLIRPADANETAVAWQVAIEANGPTGLVLSRQDLPVVMTPEQAQGLRQGAYVVSDSDGVAVPDDDLDLVLIGSGPAVSVGS